MRTLRKLFVFCLLLALPLATRAQFTFITNDDNTITITAYSGTEGTIVIPDMTNGYPVTGIGDSALNGLVATNITLPAGLTSIGVEAFAGCFYLPKIVIPGTVTNLGAAAFNSCWGLTNVTIPAGVTSIGDYAFIYCTSLPAITVDPANPVYSSVDGVLFTRDQTTLLQFPSGKSGSYAIPAGVTNLADEAFGINDYGQYPFPYTACAGLTNLSIPGSLDHVGPHAFSRCSGLISVTLANGIVSLDTNAFSWCANLASIAIPDTVTNIGQTAFYYSGLTSVTIPGSVAYFGIGAFAACSSLTNVAVQPGVTGIGEAEFNFDTVLTSITIPNSVVGIGERAFWFCGGLTNIVVPEGVTNIGSYAFSGCASLLNIDVASGNLFYSSVGGVLFDKDATTLIQFPGGRGGTYFVPEGVATIGDYAFGTYDPSGSFVQYQTDCQNLTNIVMPNTITSIGMELSDNMWNLTGVYFEGAPPATFGNLPSGPQINFFFVPGIAGWTMNSRVMPWLPALQSAGARLNGQTNQFGFNVNWARGQTVVVDACTNLAIQNWQTVQTNTITTGSDYFVDPQWTNYPARFYRVRSPQ